MSGGGIGGGIGSILGTIAASVLAPETFGASLALPIAAGAGGGLLGNVVGDVITGQPVEPGSLALSTALGGVGGGIGGELGGVAGAAGGGAGAAPISGAGGATVTGAADEFATSGALPGLSTSAIDQAISEAGGGITPAAAAAPALSTPVDTGGFLPTGEPSPDLSVGDFTALSSGGTGAQAGPALASPTLPADQGFAGATPSADSGAFGGIGGDIVSPVQTAGGTVLPGGGAPQDLIGFLKGNKDLIGPALLGGSLFKQALFPTAIPGQDTLSANSELARMLAQKFGQSDLTPQQTTQQQTMLQNQINAIKAKFANLGLSGSDAELDEIQQAQTNAFGAEAPLVSANAGIALNAINAANQPTITLANQTLAQDDALSKAIAALAAASVFKNV